MEDGLKSVELQIKRKDDQSILLQTQSDVEIQLEFSPLKITLFEDAVPRVVVNNL